MVTNLTMYRYEGIKDSWEEILKSRHFLTTDLKVSVDSITFNDISFSILLGTTQNGSIELAEGTL